VIAEAGDPMHVALLRSSAKPFQALPLARARTDLDQLDLAIAAASHLASPEQLDAVRALLAKAPAEEDELELGTIGEGAGPTKLHHNCSGKHAGMLALCRAKGWASDRYHEPRHPVQQACLAEIAAAADADTGELPVAIDGCGVPTVALPLERMALMFSRFESIDEGARIAAAMRAHPELIRGPRAADSMLMRQLDGFAAKGGAEGLMCASGPQGMGLALKVADGSTRAVRSALAEFLRRLGFESGELGHVALENSRGETVGEIVAELSRSG